MVEKKEGRKEERFGKVFSLESSILYAIKSNRDRIERYIASPR